MDIGDTWVDPETGKRYWIALDEGHPCHGCAFDSSEIGRDDIEEQVRRRGACHRAPDCGSSNGGPWVHYEEVDE